jgi:hypothetical protein
MANEKTKFSVFKKNPVSDHVRAYLAANKIEWVRSAAVPHFAVTGELPATGEAQWRLTGTGFSYPSWIRRGTPTRSEFIGRYSLRASSASRLF